MRVAVNDLVVSGQPIAKFYEKAPTLMHFTERQLQVIGIISSAAFSYFFAWMATHNLWWTLLIGATATQLDTIARKLK